MSAINQCDENQVAELHAEIVKTARLLSAGEIPFMDGLRKLDGFRFDIPQGANDPDFMLFVVIASEADHLPNAEARHLCSKAWLTKCDQEELDMKSFYSKDLSATCKLLIERFSPES